MKRDLKNFVLIVIVLFTIQSGFAQSFNYTTSDGSLGTTYSWVDCSTGGTEIQDSEWKQDQGLGDKKDDGYAEITWPFNFQFYDSYYFTGDTLYICTNGFIRFDDIPNDDASDTYNNSINTYSPNLGEIVSLAMEDCGFENSHSHARYKTTGTSPNRIFTVSMDSLEIRFNANHYVDVQVSFYETSNKIVLKFGTEDITVSAYMGIHSGNNTYRNQWQNLNGATSNRWREYTPPTKAYSAITVTQASTANVYPSNDNEILRVQFDITGGGGAFNLTDLDITAQNNSNSDVGNVKLYHTTGTTFSTDHQVGSSVTVSSGKYTFSSLGYDMPGGTSYIWVTYDIPASATNGNTVDGYIAANDISLNGTTYPSSNANPTGSRTISYFEWDGSTSTDWNTASNWSNNSVPTNSDNVIIPSAPTNQPLAGAGVSAVCNSLKIESGASITISGTGTFDVFGDMENNGTLSSSSDVTLHGSDNLIKGNGSYTTITLVLTGATYDLSNNISIDEWNISNSSTLNVGSYSAICSGNFTLSSGNTLNIGTGIVESGGVVTLSGTFNEGLGTFYYAGSNSQTIINTTYYNLKIKLSPGSRTLSNVSTNMRNLELSGTGTAALAAAININGNIVIGAGCTLNLGSYDMNIEGDWTNNGVAALGGSRTVTFDTKGTSHILGSTTFYNLTINKNYGDAEISGINHISNALTLTKGVLLSASSTSVIVDAGASAVGDADSYVDGPMRKDGNTAFTFHVGDFRRYAPCSIGTPSASTQFVAEYHESSYSNTSSFNSPLTKVSLKEYWNLTPSSAVTANVTLNWRSGSWSGIGSLTDLRLAHWNGSSWDELSGATTSGNTTSGSITVNGVNSFSPFSFGTIDNVTNPLPIQLLSFDAKDEDKMVLIDWKTASEDNNDYFIIERSKDGVAVEQIGIVEGAGSSNIVLDYDLVDLQPYNGVSYYRLTQVDYNGQSETFDWVSVNRELTNDATIDIFPNPVSSGELNMHFSNLEGQTEITIYDISGRKVYNKVQILNSENQSVSLSLDLPSGVYNIQIINGQEVITKRLIIN